MQPEETAKRIKPFPAAWKFLKETIQQTQQQCTSPITKGSKKEKIKPPWLFSKVEDSIGNQKVFFKMLYTNKENEKSHKFCQFRYKKKNYLGQERL